MLPRLSGIPRSQLAGNIFPNQMKSHHFPPVMTTADGPPLKRSLKFETPMDFPELILSVHIPCDRLNV